MSRWLIPALVSVALLNLQACSVFQEKFKTDSPSQWQELKPALERQSSWSLMGKIGIRTARDNTTAAINQWTQVDDFFDIQLSSTFLGLGSARINGTQRLVTLTESGEDPVYSDDPDTLIESALGFPLPLSFLTYWIKGLPVPEQPFQLEFNEQGLPEYLQQLDWQLEFSRFRNVEGLLLPGKIKLERQDIRIVMAIKTWQLL